MKVLIAVTHLLGTGHLSRALTLAKAFSRVGHEAVVLSGGRAAPHLDAHGVTLLQAPALASDGINFVRLLTDGGAQADAAYMANRQKFMVEALRHHAPDVVITELYPFGRRSLADEFLAILETAQRQTPRPVVLASIRDILAPPSKPAKATRAGAVLQAYYDGVLVHADAKVTQLDVSWPVTPDVEDMLRYTGYVAQPAPTSHPDGAGTDEVLVSAGGGSVGQALFEAAIGAAKNSPLRWRLLVGGGNRDARVAALRSLAADSHIVIEPVRADFRKMLHHAGASINMCGYNTALDVLQTGVPSVMVPFDDGGEVEQTLRAGSMSGLNGIDVLPSCEVTAETLGAALQQVMAQGRRSGTGVRMDGAEESVRIVQEMLAARRK